MKAATSLSPRVACTVYKMMLRRGVDFDKFPLFKSYFNHIYGDKNTFRPNISFANEVRVAFREPLSKYEKPKDAINRALSTYRQWNDVFSKVSNVEALEAYKTKTTQRKKKSKTVKIKPGTILVTNPMIHEDDLFHKAVILILERTNNHTFGIFLNKPYTKYRDQIEFEKSESYNKFASQTCEGDGVTFGGVDEDEEDEKDEYVDVYNEGYEDGFRDGEFEARKTDSEGRTAVFDYEDTDEDYGSDMAENLYYGGDYKLDVLLLSKNTGKSKKVAPNLYYMAGKNVENSMAKTELKEFKLFSGSLAWKNEVLDEHLKNEFFYATSSSIRTILSTINHKNFFIENPENSLWSKLLTFIQNEINNTKEKKKLKEKQDM